MTKLKLLIVAGVMAAAGSAFAQQGDRPAPSPEMQAAISNMRQACAADMKTLCDGKEGREAMMCLRQSADKASDGCKDAMAKVQAARQAAQ